MVDVLVASTWLGPLLWAALYVSDYAFTIACARMYQSQDTIVFEGSYEITPLFQADVNALRRISPRFLIALVASTGYVVVVQQTAGEWPNFYLGVLGAMVLTEVTIHLRHLRNWFLFKYGKGVIQGHVTYPRDLLLRMSAFELALFCGFFVLLLLVTESAFVLGGAAALGVLSINHYRLARRHEAARDSAVSK